MSETPAPYITGKSPVTHIASASPVVALSIPEPPPENPYRGTLVILALNFARAHEAYRQNQCAMLYRYYNNALDLLLGCAARYDEAELTNGL